MWLVVAAGQQPLEKCCLQVLTYYEAQARSNNNRGREAACHCMAELVRKLDSSAVLPFLQRIMRALLSAFRDDSWPVMPRLKCLMKHSKASL